MRIDTRPLMVLGVLAVLAVDAAPGNATTNNEADVTYYRDVLPIIQNNCQSCHRTDGLNLGGADVVHELSGDTALGARHRAQG
ncbi:MAG: hypothetical protein O3A25_06600 [Acidobacteria bacterium]|nr:hypothetical protein [Acidobacteriota bacterium]